MDIEAIRQAIRKLNWEANHWKRAKGRDTDKAFLDETEHLDPDFCRVLRSRGLATGNLLDIGTGTGWQAIRLARLGFTVTATDISRIAISDAVRNSTTAGVTLNFLEDDITRTTLTEAFDVVTDRGCFTVLPKDTLSDYAVCVARLVQSDGIFLLKVDRKQAVRIDYLLDRFRVAKICESSYSLESKQIKATFFVLQPKESTRII